MLNCIRNFGQVFPHFVLKRVFFSQVKVSFSLISAGQAGAVDEESFIQAFEDVKKINIFNGRGVTEELNKIKDTLTKTSNDWKVRMETCSVMRALLLGIFSYKISIITFSGHNHFKAKIWFIFGIKYLCLKK